MPVRQESDPDIQSMRGIHLYQYFLSNCSQRVCIALEQKGLKWTPHRINLFTQENSGSCSRSRTGRRPSSRKVNGWSATSSPTLTLLGSCSIS